MILLTKQLNPTIIISSGSISALYGRILEIFFQKGANLNKTLEQTAKLLLLYAILFSFGIIV